MKLSKSDSQLKDLLQNDPKAGRLADLQSLDTAIKACQIVVAICPQLATVVDAAGQLRAEQVEDTRAVLLLPLFQAADDLLAKVAPTGCCPLCGQFFEGDLQGHIRVSWVECSISSKSFRN